MTTSSFSVSTDSAITDLIPFANHAHNQAAANSFGNHARLSITQHYLEVAASDATSRKASRICAPGRRWPTRVTALRSAARLPVEDRPIDAALQ